MTDEKTPSIHTSAETIFERSVRAFLRERCGEAVDAKAIELIANAEAVVKASGDLNELQRRFKLKLEEELNAQAKRVAGELVAKLTFEAKVEITVKP